MKLLEKPPEPQKLSWTEHLERLEAVAACEGKVLENERRVKGWILHYKKWQLRLVNGATQDYETQAALLDLEIHVLSLNRLLLALGHERACVDHAKRELREIAKRRTRLAGGLPLPGKATE